MSKRKKSPFSSLSNVMALLGGVVTVSSQPAAAVVTKTASSLTTVMDSSKGKDRLLAIVQYSASLYKECMKDYLASKHIDQWPISMCNAKSIKKSMSQGRKIFRLLKFMDELVNVDTHFQLLPRREFLVVLQCMNDLFSFGYYALDNIVWLASIGLLEKYVLRSQVKWKVIKDSISLLRNLIDVLMCGIILYKSKGVENRLRVKLRSMKFQQTLYESSKSYSILLQVLEVRRDRYYRIIDLIQDGLRIVMLVQQLGLPGSLSISRPLVCVCGLVQSMLSVFKMIYEKPKVKVIEKKMARTEVS